MKPLVLCCCAALCSTLFAGEKSGLGDNAALQYWVIFDYFVHVAKPDRQLGYLGFNAPRGKPREELAAMLRPAVDRLLRASKIADCSWGFRTEQEGPSEQGPHLSHGRMLARYACMVAREDFDAGRFQESQETLLAVLELSRHIGMGNTAISRHMEVWIKNLAMNSLAMEIPTLPRKQLEQLAKRLKSWPKSSTLADAIRSGERGNILWMKSVLEKPNGLEQLKQEFGELKDLGLLDNAVRLKAELENCEALCEELAAAAELPLDQYLATAPARDAKVKNAGSVAASLFLTEHTQIRMSLECENCRKLMLSAGILIALDPAAAAQTHDPYNNDKPFDYEKTAFGFRLKSVMPSGPPITLVFGIDPNEKAPDPDKPVPDVKKFKNEAPNEF